MPASAEAGFLLVNQITAVAHGYFISHAKIYIVQRDQALLDRHNKIQYQTEYTVDHPLLQQFLNAIELLLTPQH